jgi:hypothetical protein
MLSGCPSQDWSNGEPAPQHIVVDRWYDDPGDHEAEKTWHHTTRSACLVFEKNHPHADRRRDSRLHENLPIDTHYHFPALIPPQSSMLEQFSLGKAEPHAFSWLALRLRMTETGGRMRDFGS